MSATLNGKATTSAPAAPARRTPAGAQSLRLAAIDVGSNSIHMIVAQVDADGGVTTLWRLKEPVGLGRISFPSRRLSKEAMDRAVAALRRFQRAAQLRGAEKIVVIATSAVREASNGGDLIERVRRELKLRIKVVNAPEEARLIYLGVRHATPLDGPTLLIDIGGGSVEFVVGDAESTKVLESRKLGAARMTGTFVHSDPINKDDREKLLAHYEELLAPLAEKVKAAGPTRVVGTSGTLENIGALCGDEPPEDAPAGIVGVIEKKSLEKLAKKIAKTDGTERGRMRGLDEGRKDQIVAGVLLVRELFRHFEIDRMLLCGAALREGILVDYFERNRPGIELRREVPDPRRRSVLDLARKCDWHKSHSTQVAHLTLRLFDELRPLHELGVAERELIEYAALLHDIGWHIGKKKHHKHSQYLIEHGRLKGFEPDEVDVMAAIARYHRKALPKAKHDPYGGMNKTHQRLVEVGGALLRIADGLDRSHAGVVKDLRCRVKGKEVRCTLDARVDAELEVWAATRKADLFERTFARPITFGT